jgi:AcrR family transcriptional regulator
MTMRQELALKTREHLVEAAKQVIALKGFKDASIQDITEKAGVAKGSFYTYFKSKEEIVEELVSKKIIKYEDEFLNKPLGEKIKLFNQNLMGQIQACDVEICRQWIVNNLKPVELDKIGYDFECIRIILRSSLEKGELKKDAPIEELANFVINTIYGMMLNWCMTDKKYEPQDHLRITTEFILNGIKQYSKAQ